MDYIHSAVDRTPYTYLIGWSSHKIWYYGVRYAKNCHPSDLFTTYKTSSRSVKSFIDEFGLPDIIQVRKTFDSIIAGKNFEDTVLRRLKVASRADFLNIKGDSFRNLDVTKVRHRRGKDNPIHRVLSTEEGRAAFSAAVSKGTKKGHANSEKSKEVQIKNKERLLSDLNPGKNPTLETRKNMSIAQKKRMENVNNRPIGSKNGMFGKHQSDELKRANRETAKALRASEVFDCPYCDRTIKTTANFQKHLTVTHGAAKELLKTLSTDCRRSTS